MAKARVIDTEHRLLRGDCIEGMAQLQPSSVKLCIADPPFNIGLDYDVYEDKRPADEYLDWCRQWMRQVYDLLTPDGAFWLCIGDEFASDLDVLARREIGFHMRNKVIWHFTFGPHCEKKFSRCHTNLFYYTKHRSKFTFNKAAVAVPSARQAVYGDKRAMAGGKTPADVWVLEPKQQPWLFQGDQTVWHGPRVAGTFKSRVSNAVTQMPEQVIGRMISACSNHGDLVLDPMVGTGTTGATAKKLSRRFVGFELSAALAAAAGGRIRDAQVGAPLSGPDID